jgi:hypothetical protein
MCAGMLPLLLLLVLLQAARRVQTKAATDAA